MLSLGLDVSKDFLIRESFPVRVCSMQPLPVSLPTPIPPREMQMHATERNYDGRNTITKTMLVNKIIKT